MDILTKDQNFELVAVIAEHPAAIIGFGAEMYRQGYVKGCRNGAIALLAGMVTGAIIEKVVIPKAKEFIKNKTK